MVQLYVLFTALMALLHPLHLTSTSVEITDKQELSVVVKFFADDFKAATGTFSGTVPNLDSGELDKDSQRIVMNYLVNKLVLSADHEPAFRYRYQKAQRQELAVWIFFVVKMKSLPKQIRVNNELMCESFHDQKNLLIFTNKEAQQAISFDCDTKEAILNVN
jgi:hypothetical protein